MKGVQREREHDNKNSQQNDTLDAWNVLQCKEWKGQ